MPAECIMGSDQTAVVVVRIPRTSMDETWESIYSFVEGDSANGTYSIRDGGVDDGTYRYHFVFSDHPTAFDFKLRFA